MQNNLSAFTQEALLGKFELAWQEMMTYANAIPQNNKTAFVLGGQPGSGKSSSAEKIKQEFLGGNCIFISGDDFRKYHPHFKEIYDTYGADSVVYTHRFASDITKNIRQKCIEQKYSVIVVKKFNSFKP